MARLRDLLLAAALLAACGGEAAVAPPEDFPEPPDAGERAQADAAVDREGPDAAGSDASSSGADASARPDAGTSRDAATSPFPTPIRYLVVVVKENHTFDNYFYGFPGVSSPAPARVTLSDGTKLDLTLQDAPRSSTGAMITFPYPDASLNHSNARGREAWHNGGMDRFDRFADGSIDRNHPSFFHYPEDQIPNYWKYARNYVLADDFFSTVMAPSSPGHVSVTAGFSPVYGNTNDCPVGATCTRDPCDPANQATMPHYTKGTCATFTGSTCFNAPTYVDILPPWATWRVYGGSPIAHFKSIHDSKALVTHERRLSSAIADFRSGDMANVTVIDIDGGPISEHPPQHPCTGENHSVAMLNALMDGPHWSETAVVITWDDWGGWYDHVPPTVDACQAAGAAFNTGFRLPLLLISPYARKGATGPGLVFHQRSEQASITRLIGELFHDPAQSQRFVADLDPRSRDKTAGSLLGAFDFTQRPRAPLTPRPQQRTGCPAPP